MVSSFLSLGYCCKSRLLTLPAESNDFPAPDGEEFNSPRRWFDFSDAVAPLPEFEDLASDTNVCPRQARYNRWKGWMLTGVHKNLVSCMNRVILRGCIEEYLGDFLRKAKTCPKRERAPESYEGNTSLPSPRNTSLPSPGNTSLPSPGNISLPSPRVYGEVTGGAPSEHWDEGKIEYDNPVRTPSSSPSLVMHIRSGDIFGDTVVLDHYGQPPLAFYIAALGHRNWSSVSIITYSSSEKTINPMFIVLDMLAKSGSLGNHVKTLINRPLMVDLQEMLCADALVLSKSTLHFLTSGHTRAEIFYVPDACNYGKLPHKGRYYVQSVREAAVLILNERPHAEVYGIEWATNSTDYDLYSKWNNSLSQHNELLFSREYKGLERCTLPSKQGNGGR